MRAGKSGKMPTKSWLSAKLMTRILLLDSATDACSVALLDSSVQGSDRIRQRFELAVRSHTQRLLPMVDEVLSEAALGLSDIDALAFGHGPGSFTGLRICLGVVQGLAFARDLPVVGVSTLKAMAVGFYREHPALADTATPLLVALDARMQEVYWILVQRELTTGALVTLAPEAVASPERVVEHPAVVSLAGQFWGVGQGWQYPSLQILEPPGVEPAFYPSAADMAESALRAYERGEAQPAELVQPVYLRNTISWKKRQRIRS